MIERLRIEGFKAIGTPGIDLALAPITLLLGENSVGKSSIFQSLLTIQQSWATFEGIGTLSPVGSLVDLGRFSNLQHRMGDYVFQHVKIEIIEEGRGTVGFCWNAPEQPEVPDDLAAIVDAPNAWPGQWRLREATDRGSLKSLHIDEFTFLAEELSGIARVRLTLSSESVSHWLHRKPDPLVEAANQAGARFHWWVEAGDSGFQSPYIELQEGQSNVSSVAIDGLREQLQNTPNLEGSIWNEASRALQKLLRLRRQLRNSAHIGGIRERGRRLYEVAVSDGPCSVGASGERIVDLLTYDPEALDRTNRLLGIAEIDYHVTVENPPTQAQVREILLEDLRPGRGQGNLVGLPDVGTGISQILPFAVQIAFFGNSRRFDSDPLLLMEQPELHLHPLLQARLARLMASAVTLEVDEDSDLPPSRPVQFLIETHSEHLVRALSVLIERKELPKEAVSIIKIVRNEDGEVIATRMRMDDDGRFLDSWPGGFFPEREKLLDGKIP
ncbi:MAG: AAA family ATPase [Vulcanimicrobiota bacterium]